MRKIILVGILPPPYNGQSICFNILVNKLKSSGVDYKVINIAGSYRFFLKGHFVLRAFDFIIILTRLFFSCLFSRNLVYIQMAQGARGFRRDKLINKIALMFKSIIVGHLHGGNYNGFFNSQDDPTKKDIRNELQKYNKIIVLSNNLKKMFDFEPLLNDRVVAIPNGVGEAVLNPAGKSICDVIASGEPLIILYLSNLIYSKGYLDVLESLSILKSKGVKFKAFFCGQFDISTEKFPYKTTQEAKSDFYQKIRDYELTDEVIYKGVTMGDEKRALLNEAHFFVLPITGTVMKASRFQLSKL